MYIFQIITATIMSAVAFVFGVFGIPANNREVDMDKFTLVWAVIVLIVPNGSPFTVTQKKLLCVRVDTFTKISLRLKMVTCTFIQGTMKMVSVVEIPAIIPRYFSPVTFTSRSTDILK